MMDEIYKWHPGVWDGFVAKGEHVFAVVTDRMDVGPERIKRTHNLQSRDVEWFVRETIDGPLLAQGMISGDGVPITDQKKMIRSGKAAALSALKLVDGIVEDRMEAGE